MNYQLATLFGLGRLPGGGTWASLFVLILAILSNDPFNILIFFTIITLISAPSIYKKSLPLFNSKDPKEFVLDEIIGMTLALMMVYMFSDIFGGFAFNLPSYISNQEILFLMTFTLFRIFDISKIGPVGWTEDPSIAPSWWKTWNGAEDNEYMKVIGDDIVAAFLSAVIIIIMLSIYLWVL
jgi:phosphatidylglycerophosphatase A